MGLKRSGNTNSKTLFKTIFIKWSKASWRGARSAARQKAPSTNLFHHLKLIFLIIAAMLLALHLASSVLSIKPTKHNNDDLSSTLKLKSLKNGTTNSLRKNKISFSEYRPVHLDGGDKASEKNESSVGKGSQMAASVPTEQLEHSFYLKTTDPVPNLFETFYGQEEEDEEDFYEQNPVDLKHDFDADQETNDIKVNESDFRDPYVERSVRKPIKRKDPQSSSGDYLVSGSLPRKSTTRNRYDDKVVASQSKQKQAAESYGSGSMMRNANSRQDDNGSEDDQLAGSCAVFLPRLGCLTFGQVEWALDRARDELRYRRPRGLSSPEPSERTINAVGELTEMTTRILAAQFGLDWQDIGAGLSQIDIRQTSLWRDCPLIFRRAPMCSLFSRYRTHSGQCNNPIAGYIGASNMAYVRMLPSDYADGVGIGRRAMSGNELPPARVLALALHPDIENPSAGQSVLFMAWGQLLNHDISLASGARAGTGHGASCCGRRPDGRVCMPIEVFANDPLYGRYGVRCHDFKRSLAGLRPGCSLGPRTQINLVSSYVDGSFVYGNSRSASGSLRAGTGGLLEMWDYFEDEGLAALLPPQTEEPDEECVGRRNGLYCFRSGDPRTNQQVQLVALHTIHARQHNRLAGALAQLNPHWSDNRLYHEARHIHIAMIQHILLTEYLPLLLGPRLQVKYNLSESDSYWDHYEASLNPGASQGFAAAAFRQGHTTVPGEVYRFNRLHEPVQVYRLRDLYRQPWVLFEVGAVDEFLLGTLTPPAQSFDPFVSQELSGQLLKLPDEPFGLDLTAINIQRGRDQGVPGYNAFRDWCGLERVSSFAELDAFMSSRSSQVMAQLYETVDDIDLFVGGISEFPLDGVQLGPTFACIVGRQFSALRSGDRFWFESSMGPQAFTVAQLESIKQVTLARVICANSDAIDFIQALAMQLPHPVLNPRIPCNSLPDLDITLWFEPRPTRVPQAAQMRQVAS